MNNNKYKSSVELDNELDLEVYGIKEQNQRCNCKKPPPLKKGTLTTRKYMDAIFARVRKMPEYTAFKSIDGLFNFFYYFRSYEITRPNFKFIASISYYIKHGSYIYCHLDGDFDDFERDVSILIGHVYTPDTSIGSVRAIGKIAGLLAYTATEYLNEQIDRGYFDQKVSEEK